MIPPTIEVVCDFDTGLYQLIATSYGMTGAAGPRLFRREPHPRIKFQHEDLNLAEADAVTLRKYIEETWTQKKMSKKQLQKQYD